MAQRKTTRDIREMKVRGEKIACLTAYDYLHARVLDQAGIDIVLVGDSLGMVFGGHDTTLPVTFEDMLHHTAAVSRGVRQALVVADMPFLSYQADEKSAIENCGRFLKAEIAQAVKVEGGSESICRLVARLTEIGIPVMGHLGLTPQSVHALGGFHPQGKTDADAKRIFESARKIEEAGAFCVVLEAIPTLLAKKITKSLSIPTIGIGAGPDCDGQVLVTADMLGLFEDFKPKFVRRYMELGKEMRKAVTSYIGDVRKGRFPSDSESYH